MYLLKYYSYFRQMHNDNLLTYKQYSESIGCKVQWIYRLVKRGQLISVIIAGKSFIEKGSVPIRGKVGRPRGVKKEMK